MKDKPSKENCHNQLSHLIFSHIEHEGKESLTQGKIHIQQNLNEGQAAGLWESQ